MLIIILCGKHGNKAILNHRTLPRDGLRSPKKSGHAGGRARTPKGLPVRARADRSGRDAANESVPRNQFFLRSVRGSTSPTPGPAGRPHLARPGSVNNSFPNLHYKRIDGSHRVSWPFELGPM
ncbi:hypothetical protein EVAR_69808_1 [Eumeta japonica]|uniref:Uncharacterized protein n=1 Tax=Eumeta variegata TaxID=151549 RepID=A0A4C1Z1X0_EUMVA|nr:hypothetical protein EVAR_69808_1 [Eumeta japonica]